MKLTDYELILIEALLLKTKKDMIMLGKEIKLKDEKLIDKISAERERRKNAK